MGSNTSKVTSSKFKNYVNWFEIPALNIQRATAFYSHIYNMPMSIVESNGYAMSIFPTVTGVGGAIVMGPGSTPSEFGALVYLNGGNDLNHILNRIEPAGGRIILNKTLIDQESGFFALFIDSEGNKMALHSKK